MNSRIGVLLVNLGTPEAAQYDAVKRYLNEFLTDERVIDLPWLSTSPARSRVDYPAAIKKLYSTLPANLDPTGYQLLLLLTHRRLEDSYKMH